MAIHATILGKLKALALRLLPSSAVFALQKVHYARAVRRFSQRDEPEVTIVQRLAATGAHVIDVGAHVGWYTRVLSDSVGPGGFVYSIEPIPSTSRILQDCVERLRMTNVVVRSCAISDADYQTAVMHVPQEDSGYYNFYRSSLERLPADDPALSFSVEKRTLDGLFPNPIEDIAFIKIDAEGHALPVLCGALRLLRRCKPALMIEVFEDLYEPDTQGYRIGVLLGDLGYSAWWYDGTRLHRHQRGDRPVNNFFLTDRQLAGLVACGTPIATDRDRAARQQLG